MQQLAQRSFSARFTDLIRQGLTPDRLALTLALGIGLSCFPIFGTTTILCTLVALAFRLNLPAIQVGNYLALPLQLVLFVPFLRLGERLLHAQNMPLSPEQLLAMAKTDPNRTMHILLSGQWHSIIGWLIVAPGMTLVLTFALRPLMSLLLAQVATEPAAITIER